MRQFGGAPVQLEGAVGKGSFTITGKLQPVPMIADIEVSTSKLDVVPFEGYVSVPLNVQSGSWASAYYPENARKCLARGHIFAGTEGDACRECGQFTLVRNGTCLKCTTCGGTTGCS